ncbi:MAG: zinc ribbon domain-containing protein [Peptococcaceae bacterium]
MFDVKKVEEEFKCQKCGSVGAEVREVAMTGTGLSKLFDIQNNEFLFISCKECGFTEVFNLHILEKRPSSWLMDFLIGG